MTSRPVMTPRFRTELRDLLAQAWDSWIVPSDEGPERSARALDAGEKAFASAVRAGEVPASLWALLAEIRPEAPPHDFDAMLSHWTEWKGRGSCKS